MLWDILARHTELWNSNIVVLLTTEYDRHWQCIFFEAFLLIFSCYKADDIEETSLSLKNEYTRPTILPPLVAINGNKCSIFRFLEYLKYQIISLGQMRNWRQLFMLALFFFFFKKKKLLWFFWRLRCGYTLISPPSLSLIGALTMEIYFWTGHHIPYRVE